jgi:hypothetical protein
MTPRRSIFLLACASIVACAQPEPPAVHRAVSATIEHFAPGLAIGQTLAQSAAVLGNDRWVQHAGLVGIAPRKTFAQARVYPDSAARAGARMNPEALVHAVELANDGSTDRVGVMSDLAIAFRGVPKQGCLVPVEPEGLFRSVTYWVAPGDAGGAAILEEWGDKAIASHQKVLWSLFVWGGPLRNTETFLGAFEPGFCDRDVAPIVLPAMTRTVAAVEALQQAFGDSVRGLRQGVVDAAERERLNERPLDACMTSASSVPVRRWELDGLSIELPTDMEAEHDATVARRGGGMVYAWRTPDGTRASIRTGPDSVYEHEVGGTLVSHCTEPAGGRARDIDLIKMELGFTQRHVKARFPRANAGLTFEGIAGSREREEQLLRAAHSIQITSSRW